MHEQRISSIISLIALTCGCVAESGGTTTSNDAQMHGDVNGGGGVASSATASSASTGSNGAGGSTGSSSTIASSASVATSAASSTVASSTSTGGGVVLTPGPVDIQYPGSLQNPCFSPDGSMLVFTSFSDAYNEGSSIVGVVSVDGGAPVVLSDTTSQNVNLPGACWNAATNMITYTSDATDNDEVYVVSPNGGAPVRVTHRPNNRAWEPSFSPDGQWIVFESHDLSGDDPGSIWKVKVDGTGLTQLTDGSGDDREPNWSPAGDRILFQSSRNGNIDIFTIDTNGGSLAQVTTSDGDDTDASWSPDGARIVYSTDEGELDNAAVYVIPSNGGKPARVTMQDDYCGAPSWSSDGKWIAYETTPGDPDTSSGATIGIVAAP